MSNTIQKTHNAAVLAQYGRKGVMAYAWFLIKGGKASNLSDALRGAWACLRGLVEFDAESAASKARRDKREALSRANPSRFARSVRGGREYCVIVASR